MPVTGTAVTGTTTASVTPTAAQMVAAIDAALYGRLVAGGVQDYSIGERRISAYRPSELLPLRKHYAGLASLETVGGTVTYARFGGGV